MRQIGTFIKIAAPILVIILFLLAWVDSAWLHPAHNIPIYPGAQEIAPIGTEAPTGVSFSTAKLHRSFASNDTPEAIELFYIKKLTAQGWIYNQCHDFTYDHESLIATVTTGRRSDGKTYFTLTMWNGRTSCDYEMP